MVTKRTGISRDLIIHPGETIAELLEERGMTQSELAIQTGVTAAYVSNVIAGKKGISSGFALALEYALGVSRTFWLNLQANYDAELLTYNEEQTVTDEEREAREALTEVVQYLRKQGEIPQRESIDASILSLRKYFGFRSIDDLKDIIPAGEFRIEEGSHSDPYVLGAWIRMCQLKDAGAVAADQPDGRFDKGAVRAFVEVLNEIRRDVPDDLEGVMKAAMAGQGIDFSVMKRFGKAPVDGYIVKKKNGVYRMVLTERNSKGVDSQACSEAFWFSLFHELGHIVNGDVVRAGFIDDASDAEKEARADQFANEAMGI